MGNANARGSYEDRKQQAIAAGRTKKPHVAREAQEIEPMAGFLAWWKSQMVAPRKVRSWVPKAAK